jgi:hypothetical protein
VYSTVYQVYLRYVPLFILCLPLIYVYNSLKNYIPYTLCIFSFIYISISLHFSLDTYIIHTYISQYAPLSISELSILLSSTTPHISINLRVCLSIFLPISPHIKSASPFLYVNSCARIEGISFPSRHLWD